MILCDANRNALCTPDVLPRHEQRIRLLSFNIQVGISTSAYRHYVTRSWKHLIPHQERYRNLEKIGFLLGDYDIVALQEADGGSLRSGNINQVQQLAQLGNFPYWYQQRNRNLGPFAQHSNGLLTRMQPQRLEDHPLPGPAGRGAILAQIGEDDNAIAVVSMHLALGTRARTRQLDYIREIVSDYKHIILMGDMNTHAEKLLINSPLSSLNLRAPQVCATFPSWNPQRCLDHILISSELEIANMSVLPVPISDHLPVSMDIILPTPDATYKFAAQ
ncbi:MAG TPA: endonuclease/exonuclease/phosphatase family protein [Thiopseudomonas sp.]|nr:endonuclease/exonuclease/phosphatase family protein [Thiopseudomonas sp.]